MGDVSTTRLYLGNLPRNATKQDVENHFSANGVSSIKEVKLMNGFGFIEYGDALDAGDAVPAFHGSDFMGERLVVQFARGSRPTREFEPRERTAPRPRRTVHRMTLTALPEATSWQDLKDFARQPGLDVVYSEVSRDRDGKGFVEYETAEDLATAVEKLDGREFKGTTVQCISDPQSEIPRGPPRQDRFRSRSPPPRRGGGYGGAPPADDYYYDRRGPPRGYSPRRDDYRRRSPPPRDYYDRRGGDPYPPRSPPRARGPPPVDDYAAPPPRRAYPDDGYGAPPPPRRYEADPYTNGHGRESREPREPYARDARPAPPASPPRRDRGYGDAPGYERRGGYW